MPISPTLPTNGQDPWGTDLNTALTTIVNGVNANETALAGKASTSHTHSGADIVSGTVVAARLPTSSTTASGIVELATTAETQTGSDTTRAVTPAGLAATSVPKSLVDLKGDLFVGSANDTPARLAVGTNGQVLTADSAETTGVKWATPSGGGSGAGKNWLSAIWGLPGVTLVSGIGNESSSANTLYMVPFKIDTAATLTDIAINVGTAGTAGTNARLGIYSKDATGTQWTLVNDAGTVSIASTGDKTLTGLSISLASAGIYGVAVLPESTCSLNSRAGGMTLAGPASASPFNSNVIVYMSVGQAYGALPGTASPTGQGSFGTSYQRAVVKLA